MLRACRTIEKKKSKNFFSGEPSFKGNKASLSFVFVFTCDVEFLLTLSLIENSLVVYCLPAKLLIAAMSAENKSNCRKELRFPVSISILPILMCCIHD